MGKDCYSSDATNLCNCCGARNDDSKNLKEHGIEIEIKHKEKDNQNLFKIENHDKNKKIDNDKANEIKDFTEKRVINNSPDRINNSQMNFGKLSDNN